MGTSPSPATAIASAGISLITDIINIGLASKAAEAQKLETQAANATSAADYTNEANKEQQRYDYSKNRTEGSDAYNKLISDRRMLDSFAGDLQNYLNSDQKNADRIVNLFRRAA